MKFQDKFYYITDQDKLPFSDEKEDEKCIFQKSHFNEYNLTIMALL